MTSPGLGFLPAQRQGSRFPSWAEAPPPAVQAVGPRPGVQTGVLKGALLGSILFKLIKRFTTPDNLKHFFFKCPDFSLLSKLCNLCPEGARAPAPPPGQHTGPAGSPEPPTAPLPFPCPPEPQALQCATPGVWGSHGCVRGGAPTGCGQAASLCEPDLATCPHGDPSFDWTSSDWAQSPELPLRGRVAGAAACPSPGPSPRCHRRPCQAPLTALLFFLPWLSLDQDECLLGAHDCSRRQFCVNTLGSFYCVNHTVLCAQGFILNVHRKCVGKREPPPQRPAPRSAHHARHACL